MKREQFDGLFQSMGYEIELCKDDQVIKAKAVQTQNAQSAVPGGVRTCRKWTVQGSDILDNAGLGPSWKVRIEEQEFEITLVSTNEASGRVITYDIESDVVKKN